MEMQTGNPAAEPSPISDHESSLKKSTGPRTAGGKRRSSRNALKHGLYSRGFFQEGSLALGEDPRQYERLRAGLKESLEPVGALESVLVEDIALLVSKKVRLEQAELAVQVTNLQKHDLERRKLSVQVGRGSTEISEYEAREKGLRRGLNSPGQYEQVGAHLRLLLDLIDGNDFSERMRDVLRTLYGIDPTLRGANLGAYCSQLRQMQPGDPDLPKLKEVMSECVREEIGDVERDYALFLHEHVANCRAARVAATAPTHSQWAAIIGQQNALHRQMEHKIRLLEEVQAKRQAGRGARPGVPTLPGNDPAGAPTGGGGSCGRPEGSADLPCRSAALSGQPKTADLGKQVCATSAWRGGSCGCPQASTRVAPRLQPPTARAAVRPACPCTRSQPENRGNELNHVLQRKGLTKMKCAKRTRFRPPRAALNPAPMPLFPLPAGWSLPIAFAEHRGSGCMNVRALKGRELVAGGNAPGTVIRNQPDPEGVA